MTTTATRSKGPLIALGVGAVVVLAALAAIFAGGRAGDGATVTAPVAVSGEALPPLDPEAAADPALGVAAPTVAGEDFEGRAVTAPAPGRPGIVLFLAHWCPACQQEVPMVRDWHDGGGLPGDVGFVAVSTSVTPGRDNFPPSAWFEREAWTLPLLVDDEASAAAEAYGLTAFPFWVFVNGDGQVLGRLVGVLDADTLDQAVAALQQSR